MEKAHYDVFLRRDTVKECFWTFLDDNDIFAFTLNRYRARFKLTRVIQPY